MRRLLMAAVACAAALPVLAEPPPGTDLNSWQHKWFERQYAVNGIHCCEIADGHFLDDTQWGTEGDHYWVMVAGQRMKVEPYQMRDPVRGGENPFGKAIVWYRYYPRPADSGQHGFYRIWCFSPGWEG